MSLLGLYQLRQEAGTGFANQNGNLTVKSSLAESRLEYCSAQSLHSSSVLLFTTTFVVYCVFCCAGLMIYKKPLYELVFGCLL